MKIIDRYSEKGKAMKGRDEEQQVRTEINTLGRVAGHPNISKFIILQNKLMHIVFVH